MHKFVGNSHHIWQQLMYYCSEHRASTTFSSEAVAEVSVAFKFFIETGLLALCSNPHLEDQVSIFIYPGDWVAGLVIPRGTGYPF
jgi:hypothetical protein